MRTSGARNEWRKIRFHALDIPIKKSTTVKADIDSHREQWLKEIAEGLCAQLLRNYDDRDIANGLAKLPNRFGRDLQRIVLSELYAGTWIIVSSSTATRRWGSIEDRSSN
jgi:hypothetical protein